MEQLLADIWRFLQRMAATLDRVSNAAQQWLAWQNQIGAALLQSGIVGAPGVVLGQVLARIYGDLDTGEGQPTIADLVLAVNAVSVKLDTALELYAPGEYNVIIPPSPPSGYGGSTAAQVWAYLLLNETGPGTVSADQMLTWAGQHAYNLGSRGVRQYEHSRWFTLEGSLAANRWGQDLGNGPDPDFSDIGAAETVLDWLNRTDSEYGGQWSLDATRGLCWAKWPGPVTWNLTWWCHLHQADLEAIRDGYASAGAVLAPPVWPGLANVTLGDPIAMGEDVSFDGPCDGILVALDLPVSKASVWLMADLTYSWPIGKLTFLTDRGDAEFYQFLGFDVAVYVPKTMRTAAGFRLSLTKGTGTCYPWTISTGA